MAERVMIEVEPLLWERVKRKAKAEGRTLKWAVGEALRRWEGDITPEESSRGGADASDRTAPVAERAAALRELVNAVKPGSVKTARELMQEREVRRGDESGSQIERWDDEHTF